MAPLARAQKPGKRVLGVLNPHPKPMPEQEARMPYNARFKQLGWVVGENLVIERPEHPDREAALPAMAEELVRKRVDAILAIGPEAAVAAARATTKIPIVFWGAPYPVEQGLIESFARPDRNVTGVAFFTGPEITAKVLEILREVAPGISRVAAMVTPSASSTVQGGKFDVLAQLGDAARGLGFDFRVHLITKAEDLEGLLAAILDSGARAMVAYGTTTTFRLRHRIAEFASRKRLLCASTQAAFAQAGAVFSYGANTIRTVLQSLEYVDKVLRGADPAELAVERPANYELVVNLGAAKKLELAIPQAVLLRADRVIE